MFPHLLHAFQLEQYRKVRFLRFVYTHPLFRIKGSQRQTLDRTTKAKLLFVISIVLHLATIVVAYFFGLSGGQRGMLVIANIVLSPFVLLLSSLILFPFEYIAKYRILLKAKKKLTSMDDLIVIGITGSFGKTSMKYILQTLLSSKRVLITDGSKNTPLGVSQVILDTLTPEVEIFIVEMGAYQPGNIKELCDLVRPKVGILTGIGPQHLERFGSIENIVKTKFELIESVPADGLAVVDGENEHISKHINIEGSKDVEEASERRKGFKKVQKGAKGLKGVQKGGKGEKRVGGSSGAPVAPYKEETKKTEKGFVDFSIDGCVQNITFLPNFQGLTFDYQDREFHTKLLAKHSAKAIGMAMEVAQRLGISLDELEQQVPKIDYIKHRLQLLHNPHNDTYIIDDSYNGNVDGVNATIDLLKNVPFAGKKIYLTPGLVELGDESYDIHFQIGQQLAEVVDTVLLIDNANTQAIKNGLKSKNFDDEIVLFPTTQQAHMNIGKYTKKGSVIVFQNDLTDNYG